MNDEILMLVIFLGAFFSPFFARAFRMPVPVGELVFGLILGNLLAPQLHIPEALNFLAEFGFLILMFLAGLEIDFNLIEKIPLRNLIVYMVYVIAILITSFFLLFLLGKPIVIGLIISLISVGLLLATLRDLNILNKPISQRILVIGVIGEVISLIFLTFLYNLGRVNNYWELITENLKVFVFFGIFFLTFYLVKLLLWWFPEIVRELTYEEDPSGISIRLSLFLMFASSVVVHFVGLERVLGAFLAGAVLSYFIRRKHDLEEKLSAIGYGFLIPIFFIKTGMTMQISGISASLALNIFFILLLMLIVRFIPAPLLLITEVDKREILAVPLFLSYPFTLMIAGIEIAYQAGMLNKEDTLSLIMASILSSLLFPWAGKFIKRIL